MQTRPAGRPSSGGVTSSRGTTRAAVLFCCLVSFLDGADTQSMAIAAPLLSRDLAMSPSGLGLVFSGSLLGAAIGAMLCGSLADRYGPKLMLILCTLTFGVFQFATSYADDFTSLMSLRILAGLGLGGAAPCFLALAAGHVAPATRPRLLSMIWAFFPFGGLVGGLGNGWLVQNMGWRTMFVIGGIIPILVAVALFLVVREPPGFVGGKARAGATQPSQRLRGLLTDDLLLRRRAAFVFVIFFCAFGALGALVAWMPSLLVRSGFTPLQGGTVLSWQALGALVSMATAGLLFERAGRPLLYGSLLVNALLIAGVAVALGSYAAVAVLTVLIGVTLGFAASGGIALVGSLFPAHVQSSALGWSMAVGRVGQVLLPPLIGWGLDAGLTAAAVLLALALVPGLGGLTALLISRSDAKIGG